jgi:hypothetical protein
MSGAIKRKREAEVAMDRAAASLRDAQSLRNPGKVVADLEARIQAAGKR